MNINRHAAHSENFEFSESILHCNKIFGNNNFYGTFFLRNNLVLHYFNLFLPYRKREFCVKRFHYFNFYLKTVQPRQIVLRITCVHVRRLYRNLFIFSGCACMKRSFFLIISGRSAMFASSSQYRLTMSTVSLCGQFDSIIAERHLLVTLFRLNTSTVFLIFFSC